MDTFLDGRKTSPDPLKVESKDDVIGLVDFLTDESRRCPVVVFSLPDGEDDLGKTAIDVGKFIRHTVGCVHSVVISSTASYYLSDEITKTFLTFNGAIRTYNPKFDPDKSSPYDHPITTLSSIKRWSENTSDSDYIEFLVERVLKPSRSRDELEKDIPSYQKVKQYSLAKLRSEKNNNGTDENIKLADEELEALKQDNSEYRELLRVAEDEGKQFEQERNRWKSQYIALQTRLDAVLSQKDSEKTDIPTSVDDLEDWVEKYLVGQVAVHNRAIKAAKNSNFQNVPLIYNALLLLRDYYVPMKRNGGAKLNQSYKDKCVELGLEDQQCFNQANKAKNFDGEYFVQYDGRRCELDRHLKGSSSRIRQHSFRLYFFGMAQQIKLL